MDDFEEDLKPLVIRTNLFFLLFFSAFVTFSQQTFQDIKGISVTQKTSGPFKECYEIMVDQPLDHFNSCNKFFRQRIIVGFNNKDAPTVMETEGYALSNSSLPAFMKGCNYISAEHRFFGKSLPDSLDWTYLTIKQASGDLHHIREVFGQVFKGTWMTTGTSKGGQTAIAYKMFFPNDANATLAIVTPIKNGINDKRFSEYILSTSKTDCGKKVFAFQQFAFRKKKALVKEFERYVQDEGYSYGNMKTETVFEYLLLEYPFAFYQNCFDCKLIPDTAEKMTKIVSEIASVVSPRFYSEAFRQELEPSFYMFYHELGYYEYDLTPFKQWLSGEIYPNNIFAPRNITPKFDTTYLASLNEFITNPTTEKLIFVYGELDPYTALGPSFNHNNNCLTIIAENGCHKSRVADLSTEQQQKVFSLLSTWLRWKVGT